ncbi:TspO/MBR family protein [Amycolatopsis jejuensis]|uniref:TspO/MBR family protein n=1 Tax=Amycolatopsis jejuensis TaxID=330084 RepID=UPI0006897912|nr:TspO/MBR family protein [Amycolatopsis jejuensis]
MLAVFFGLVSVVALIGGLAATSAPDAYTRYTMPSWAPPADLFSPVWTVLYAVLAVAGWTYWRTDGENQGFAAYGIGLLFNLMWISLFFAGGSTRVACVDIILLDLTVVITIGLFYRRSRVAALLLLPYLAWLLYTTALNVAIIALNDTP